MRSYAVLTAFLLLLAGCTPSAGITFETPLASPLPSATLVPTLVPTATVGYEATAIVAQQTADEALRLNVQVTAEFERRAHAEIELTAGAERRAHEAFGWTVTAAQTSVPLTATAQAANNTAIVGYQTMQSAQMTATANAPTQIVAMSLAQNQATFAPLFEGVKVFALFSLGLFLLAVVWFLAQMPQWNGKSVAGFDTNKDEVEFIHPIDLDSTLVDVRRQTDGFPSISRMRVPCSAEALTELAEGILHGGKTLGINQWEGRESKHWTRKGERNNFMEMRNFLQMNRFGRGDGHGGLVLTAEGEAFFRGWLDGSSLPPLFEFAPENSPITGESAHDHENHGDSHGVGEVQTAVLSL